MTEKGKPFILLMCEKPVKTAFLFRCLLVEALYGMGRGGPGKQNRTDSANSAA